MKSIHDFFLIYIRIQFLFHQHYYKRFIGMDNLNWFIIISMKPKAFLLIPILLLSSCDSSQVAMVTSFLSPYYIPKSNNRVCIKDDEIISPFNTSINTSLYHYVSDYSNDTLNSIRDEINFKLEYFHALSDRHYSYTLDGKDILNVKAINDSYGKNQPLVVDDFLYHLLKESYQFTLHSQGRYNMFLGSLNDIYEKKFAKLETQQSIKEKVFQDMANLHYASFSEEERKDIDEALKNTPISQSELEQSLTFDDEKKSVTFHEITRDGIPLKNVKISLGGNAKGFATEKITNDLKKEYPGISLVMNSGTSSIKTIGTRPDKKDWILRYINPAYQEYLDSETNPYNDYEFTISYPGQFNLSTSGNYENYFYEIQGNKMIKNSHILDATTGYSNNYFDQVSVFLNDAGLADMYTTALMNTSSIQEALLLFDSLNQIYQQNDAEMILSFKEYQDEYFSYSLDSYKPLSSFDLPIAVLKDGSEYANDYQSLNLSDIVSYKTNLVCPFKQVYCLTSELYQKASLITDKLKKPDNVISLLREIK